LSVTLLRKVIRPVFLGRSRLALLLFLFPGIFLFREGHLFQAHIQLLRSCSRFRCLG
jgi:hypothetical protein